MGARNSSLKQAMGIERFYKHSFDLVEMKTQVRPGGRGCSRANASLTDNSRQSQIQEVFSVSHFFLCLLPPRSHQACAPPYGGQHKRGF